MSNNLMVPENITILPPPQKSPETNPIANLWRFMCDTWRKLQQQPWRIIRSVEENGSVSFAH